MNRRLFLMSLASVVLLSGCNFIQQFIRPAEDQPAEQQHEASQDPDPAPVVEEEERYVSPEEKMIKEEFGEQGGGYRDFKNNAIGNGQESILFFHADWCPNCQNHDAQLRDWFDANYIPLSVWKVNYDKAGDLKRRYGVTQQDTFVRINGNGDAIATLTFPSDLELLQMLRP